MLFETTFDTINIKNSLCTKHQESKGILDTNTRKYGGAHSLGSRDRLVRGLCLGSTDPVRAPTCSLNAMLLQVVMSDPARRGYDIESNVGVISLMLEKLLTRVYSVCLTLLRLTSANRSLRPVPGCDFGKCVSCSAGQSRLFMPPGQVQLRPRVMVGSGPSTARCVRT